MTEAEAKMWEEKLRGNIATSPTEPRYAYLDKLERLVKDLNTHHSPVKDRAVAMLMGQAAKIARLEDENIALLEGELKCR